MVFLVFFLVKSQRSERESIQSFLFLLIVIRFWSLSNNKAEGILISQLMSVFSSVDQRIDTNYNVLYSGL